MPVGRGEYALDRCNPAKRGYFQEHRTSPPPFVKRDKARIKMRAIGKEVASVFRVRAGQIQHQVIRMRRHHLGGGNVFADDLIAAQRRRAPRQPLIADRKRRSHRPHGRGPDRRMMAVSGSS